MIAAGASELDILTAICKHAPYHTLLEFRVGIYAYQSGRFHGNPYDADSVAAQAWDRGAEAAMRLSPARQRMEPAPGVRRKLDATVARLSAETGMPYMPPAGGETVAGIYQQSLALTSGRFAVIDNGHGFALVPWTPALERQRGPHVSDVASKSGGIEWSFARKRDLGI